MPGTPSKLTIHPPRQDSISDPQSQILNEAAAASAQDTNNTTSNAGSTSPVAPAYSPITPKVQPSFPAGYPLPTQDAPFGAFNSLDANVQPPPQQNEPAITPAIAAAQYIPPPPPQPFSSEDSTDAIALRAAISSLQFQKQKAAEDIRALEGLRKKALGEPELFRSELVAGRLKERKTTVGDLRAILDHESDEDDEDEEDEAMAGAEANDDKDAATFGQIPGPQNVVRMPYVNWEKYHIHGEALDRLHEQQRKWPGSFDYGQDKGIEYSIAAPYSPWLDSVEGGQDQRKDSLGISSAGVATPTTTVSEHPMETRKGAKNQ